MFSYGSVITNAVYYTAHGGHSRKYWRSKLLESVIEIDVEREDGHNFDNRMCHSRYTVSWDSSSEKTKSNSNP